MLAIKTSTRVENLSNAAFFFQGILNTLRVKNNLRKSTCSCQNNDFHEDVSSQMLKMDHFMLMFAKEQQRNEPRSVKDLLNCFLLYFSLSSRNY